MSALNNIGKRMLGFADEFMEGATKGVSKNIRVNSLKSNMTKNQLKNLNLKFFANDTMLKEHNIPINMKLEQNEEYCQKVKFFINTEKNPTAASILLNSMFEKHIRLDSTLSFDDEHAMPTTTSITGIIK